jgi:hypothetical protein
MEFLRAKYEGFYPLGQVKTQKKYFFYFFFLKKYLVKISEKHVRFSREKIQVFSKLK